MFPVPEPDGDIKAQLLAVLNPQHPKVACFAVAANYSVALPGETCREAYIDGGFLEYRPEGRLFTLDEVSVFKFRQAPEEQNAFDAAMAEILGYPEPKSQVIAACDGRPIANARAVQARDKDGWVITEAFSSPKWLGVTKAEIQKHVPSGGTLVILTPIEAIGRRLLLREAGQ